VQRKVSQLAQAKQNNKELVLNNSPLTICLCLFSQLFGASCLLWRTTWLLWRRLVISYQAVVIMAFSRLKVLISWSYAACVTQSVSCNLDAALGYNR